MDSNKKEIDVKGRKVALIEAGSGLPWSICTGLRMSMASMATCCLSIKDWRKDAG